MYKITIQATPAKGIDWKVVASGTWTPGEPPELADLFLSAEVLKELFNVTPSATEKSGRNQIHSFCSQSVGSPATQADCADGSIPSNLVRGSDGNFYGNTLYGGALLLGGGSARFTELLRRGLSPPCIPSALRIAASPGRFPGIRSAAATAISTASQRRVARRASGTLANGATYVSGGLVPGSWAQVKGTDLSSATRIWQGSDFAGLGNNLPTNLSGVKVMVNYIPAPVYYISPGQISFQVPSGVSGNAQVQVINNGALSNTLTAAASDSSPGVFPVIENGVNYPAGVFPDGEYVGDPSIAGFRNAKPGDVIQLYATGLAVSPAGVIPSQQTLNGVTVTIGGTVIPADFAGLVAAGEFQINFTIPQSFASQPAGSYPISIQAAGVSSPITINTNPPEQIVIPIQP